jgi:hypothetical protein
MDETQFDALTKDWTRLPRRRVLGGLVAGALGSLLGMGEREARAISTTCQRSSECGAGQACVHHTCVLTCTDPFFCLKGGTSDGGTGCPSGAFCAKKPGGGGICVQGGRPLRRRRPVQEAEQLPAREHLRQRLLRQQQAEVHLPATVRRVARADPRTTARAAPLTRGTIPTIAPRAGR